MTNVDTPHRSTRTRKPTVTTRVFQRAHGKAPRGTGNWAFAPTATEDAYHADVNYVAMAFFYGTFSEARARAQWHFAEQGVALIAVLS